MDILMTLYIAVGMIYCFLIYEGDFDKSNFLFIFEKPRSVFDMLCMIIFSPSVLLFIILVIVTVLLSCIIIFLIILPILFIIAVLMDYSHNKRVNNGTYKNIKNNKIYKFLFDERWNR